MADRKARDRPRWVRVGVVHVRVTLWPVPVVEVSNRSGRPLTGEDKNQVTRWVIGVLEEAGYSCTDAMRVRDLCWS